MTADVAYFDVMTDPAVAGRLGQTEIDAHALAEARWWAAAKGFDRLTRYGIGKRRGWIWGGFKAERFRREAK